MIDVFEYIEEKKKKKPRLPAGTVDLSTAPRVKMPTPPKPIQPQAELMRSFRELEATTAIPKPEVPKPTGVDMVTGAAPSVTKYVTDSLRRTAEETVRKQREKTPLMGREMGGVASLRLVKPPAVDMQPTVQPIQSQADQARVFRKLEAAPDTRLVTDMWQIAHPSQYRIPERAPAPVEPSIIPTPSYVKKPIGLVARETIDAVKEAVWPVVRGLGKFLQMPHVLKRLYKPILEDPEIPEATKKMYEQIIEDFAKEPETVGEQVLETIGNLVPFTVIATISAPFTAGPVTASTGKILVRYLPKFARSVAGKAITRGLGSAALGGTISAGRQAFKAALVPEEFDFQDVFKEVAGDVGHFFVFGAAGELAGRPVREGILRIIPAAARQGKVTWNLATLLSAASGGAATGATIAATETALNFMKNPEEFDAAQAQGDILSTMLFFAGVDVLFALTGMAWGRRGWTYGQDPTGKSAAPAGYKWTIHKSDLSPGLQGYVFAAGTFDPAKHGYQEIKKGMGIWILPKTGQQIYEMQPIGEWYVPKYEMVRNGVIEAVVPEEAKQEIRGLLTAPVQTAEGSLGATYPRVTGKAGKPTETIPDAERRMNLALRAEIDKLSPEEKDEVIKDLRARVFTDELTGLKNRVAYMMDEKQPFQAIIDLDNLKWVNDNIGHGAGDTLIKTLASALPENSYRISGDEFIVQGQSKEELESLLSGLEARLNEQVLELAGDKRVVFKKGIGFSYGIGETLDKAEMALQEHKKARLAEGKRAERGEVPEGIVEAPGVAGEGVKVKDAIQKGKPIPPEVLKDYPELAKEAKAEVKPELEKPAEAEKTERPTLRHSDLPKLTYDDLAEYSPRETEGVGKYKGIKYRTAKIVALDEEGRERYYTVKANTTGKTEVKRGTITEAQKKLEVNAEWESIPQDIRMLIEENWPNLNTYQKVILGKIASGREVNDNDAVVVISGTARRQFFTLFPGINTLKEAKKALYEWAQKQVKEARAEAKPELEKPVEVKAPKPEVKLPKGAVTDISPVLLEPQVKDAVQQFHKWGIGTYSSAGYQYDPIKPEPPKGYTAISYVKGQIPQEALDKIKAEFPDVHAEDGRIFFNYDFKGGAEDVDRPENVNPVKEKWNKILEIIRPFIEKTVKTIDDLNLGRSGKAALRKWAANEYVNADLDNLEDPYTQKFLEFFNKYYQAGYQGLREIDVEPSDVDAEFAPFLRTEAFEAGQKDAERVKPKVLKDYPELKPAEVKPEPEDAKRTVSKMETKIEEPEPETAPVKEEAKPEAVPEVRKAVISDVTVSTAKMTNGTEWIKLQSPYHPELPSKAKRIGGKWSSEYRAWYFDKRDEERVRQLAQEIYGTRGEGEKVDVVTVRVNLDNVEGAKGSSLFLFGHEIASRKYRDSKVRLGRGVIILEGGFPDSGGSNRNPSLEPEKGTILEIRDVPLSLVQKADFPLEIVSEVKTVKPAEEKPAAEKPAKVEEKPVPKGKVKDNIEWLRGAAAEARKRIEARKAKRAEEGLPEKLAFGEPAGKKAKLPMDDFVDYAIVGAEYLVTKNPTYEEWAEFMLEEFGPAIRLFLRGIYGQSQAMLEMTPEEINEMISIVAEEVSESVPDEHGAEPLETVPSEDVQGTEEERPVDEIGIRGSGKDRGGIRGVAGAGAELRPGVGDSPGEIHSTPTRKGGPKLVTATTEPRLITSQNFRITPEIAEEIDNRSKKEKTRDNIKAIRLLKQLMTEERPATPEEQAILVKYVGWGFNKDIFYKPWAEKNGYAKEHEELKELLTEEEWDYARRSTLTAHYTATDVVGAMYEVLKRVGFDGGKVLEPALGIGHFLGLMPDEMREASWLTGVEIDKISGNIAKLLYPRANINIMGYEEFAVPYEEKKLLNENYYDLAISNVPFSDTGPAKDVRYSKIPVYNLHNFFFAKAIDQVRPGGVLMFITSRYTMDSIDDGFRKYMNERADFLGAVRLHNEAFKGIAETKVVTDIIFMRKRAEGEKYAGKDWVKGKHLTVKGEDGTEDHTVYINKYYVENPEMVIGKQTFGRGMYSYGEYKVVPDPARSDLRKEIVGAFSKILPEDAYKPRPKHKATEDPKVESMFIPPPETQPGSFFIKDGKIYQAYVDESGQLFAGPYNEILKKDGLPVPGAKVISRIKGLIKLRDVFTELVNLELKDAPEAVIDKQRKELNKVYDSFVKVHGLINSRANVAAFKDDPSYYRLTGLEVIDPDTGKFVKNDIFYRRTITKYVPATKADNAKEALLITLNEKGRVDVEHIAALTGKDVEAVTKELKGTIFNDPEKGWVTADEYLSGNVREKLRIARDAARHDPSFEDNVTALEAVQPVDKTSEDIYVKLGAPWISPEDVRDFLGHLFLDDERYGKAYFDIRYVPATSSWVIEFTSARHKATVRKTTYNQTVYALDYKDEATGKHIRRDALSIIDKMLNSKPMIATYKDPHTERYKVHAAASLAMKEKAKQIEEEFRKWIWSDESRKKRLLKKYNWEYNSIRKREWNGDHLTFPGMNPAIKLAKHQKNAVWQIIQGVPTLLHHTVGAGKTFEMVAAAMELKRLGFASKPLLVTRNHLVGDIYNEARKLYPAAKIIHYTEKDFYKNNRRKTLAKIVAGDWDLIIMPHSSFKFIPVSAKYTEKLINREIAKIERSILDARIAEGQASKSVVRDMENAKIRVEKKLRDRLKDIQEHQDQGFITFEETGIDAIFIDEAHHFKNLLYITKMNRVGNLGSQDGSQAAFDLLTKVEYIRGLRGGSGIVFATATPLSNTMAEIYHMQRYLQPEELEAKGIYSFDSWARTFGEIVTGIELKPSGKGYQPKERFRKFNNISALMQMYHSFANVVNKEKMLELSPNIKLPKLATGKRQMILSEPSLEMQMYIEELDHRLELIKRGAVTPREDNTLKVLADGKMAALFGPLRGLPDYKSSKISKLVENVYKIWERDKKDKLTQLVFLDLGTPKGDSGEVDENTGEAKMTKEEEAYWAEVEVLEKGVYEVIKRRLIVLGVPEEEIAIMHDYNTDTKKQGLFRQVRSGEVRILIGSTRKMGEGMNVQRKLKVLHHVDAPWKPSEIEQREGRIIRQGNQNEEVEIYCYATTGTLDTFFWQTLEQKQGYLSRFENGDMTLDKMDDIDETTASYAILKALATGDQRIVEHAELSNRMIELKALEQSYVSSQTAVQMKLTRTETYIEMLKERIQQLEADIKKRQDIKADKFKVTLFGKEYTERAEAGNVLIGKEGPLKNVLDKLPDSGLWKSHHLVDEFVKKLPKDIKAVVRDKVIATIDGRKESVPLLEIEVGNFAGFPLKLIANYGSTIHYVLEGKDKYDAYLQDNPLGMVRLLETRLQFEKSLEKLKKELETENKNLEVLKKELGKPFEYKGELLKTAQRIEELEIELGMRESSGLADEMVDAEEDDIGGITESKKGTVQITTNAGKIKVPGVHIAPGLVANENRANDKILGWTVTHLPSGLSLGTTFQKKETAIAAANAVAKLADWTIEDTDELRKKLDIDKIKNIMAQYLEQELREIGTEELNNRAYDTLLNRSEIGEYDVQTLRHDPAVTSLKQVAKGLKLLVNLANKGVIDKPAFHFDVGGDAYDLGINYLAEHGIECILWDPEARTPDYNKASLERLKQVGGADTASLNNVLNILPEKEDRLDAIRFMYQNLKQGGTGIITVYEGKRTGKMEKVIRGDRYNYQLNRKLDDYLPEIEEALSGNIAEIQKKYGAIIITKKKPLSFVELYEGLPEKPTQETIVPFKQKIAAKEKPVRFRTKKATYQQDLDDRLPEILESIEDRDPEKYKAAMNSLKDDTGDKVMDRVVRKDKLIKMADELVSLYIGRVRGKRAGFFKTKEELVRIRTEFFSDLDYLTHELGHYLDKALMLTRPRVIRMAMQKDLGNKAYDILTSELMEAPYVKNVLLKVFPEADFKLQVHEGLADFIRAYIVEPEEAKKNFPNFHTYFERILKMADGDITEKISDLQRMVALYINQPPEAMIASFIGSDEKEKKSILSGWYYKLVDEAGRIAYVVEQIIGDKRFWGKSPGGVDVISPDKNPYLLHKAARAFQGKAHLYVKHGQYVRSKNNKLEKIGPSLDEITRPIFEMGKYDNGVSHFERWTYYMVAKRAIEIEDVKKLKSGMDKYQMQAARDFVDSIEGNKDKGIPRATYADIYKKQFKELVKFMHFNLSQLLDAGIIDKDSYDNIVKTNEFYIPFYRVRDDRAAKKAEGQHLGNLPKGVYKYRGASLPIYDPWDSILRQVFIYTALADKNKAIGALVDMADEWEGTGRFFSKVPAPLQVTKATLGEALTSLGIHISDKVALEKIGEAIAEEVGTNEINMDTIIKIFRPIRYANVRENVITVWKNGKPVFYEFKDKELLKAIMHLDTDAITLLEKLVRPFSQILRVGATWNPRFIGFNPFRDNVLSGIWGEKGYLPFVDLFRGIFHIAKKSDEYKDWLEAGGAMSTLNTWDRNYFKEYAGKYVEKKYYEMVLKAINPIGWLGKASGVMEYATNVGQYVKARKKGAHPVAANFLGRDITVDHLRHGSQTHRIRSHIPFFNAWVQGTDKTWRAFKKNPTRFLFRALIMITLPTIALYLTNRRNPYYQELPAWRKHLYWNIPVSIGGNTRTTKYFILLPRPFIPGLVFGGMVEYLLNKFDEQNMASLDELSKDIFNTLLPNYTPAWVGPLLELWANQKIYTDTPIVPASEERLWPSDQYGPYTSEVAKKLGKALNVSPRKIDALIYGYTAGLGRHAVRGTDEILYLVSAADKELRPADTVQDIPFLGDIIIASGSYGATSLTRFYNDLRKAEKIAAKEQSALERGETISLTKTEELYRDCLPTLRAINRDLAKLNRYMEAVYETRKLTRKEKRQMVDLLELAKINKVRVAYGLDPIPMN